VNKSICMLFSLLVDFSSPCEAKERNLGVFQPESEYLLVRILEPRVYTFLNSKIIVKFKYLADQKEIYTTYLIV